MTGCAVSFPQSDEVGDFKGWEVVSAQVKEGRHIIKQYVDFLKQR